MEEGNNICKEYLNIKIENKEIFNIREKLQYFRYIIKELVSLGYSNSKN